MDVWHVTEHLLLARQIFSGGDVNKCDNDGRSPIYIAASSGHSACISQLLASRADARSTYNGTSALDIARQNNHNDSVRVLEAALAWSGQPYSFSFLSWCLSKPILSSSINLQTSAINYVAMQAFSKIKHDSVGRHEEQIFQSVLQQPHQTSSGQTWHGNQIRMDGSIQEEYKKTAMMR